MDAERADAPSSGAEADAPVFVDDSGRRLARARWVVRLGVVLVGAYGVLVVIGLAGSASWPALHLADLGRLATKSAAAPHLDKSSQVAALPASLRPRVTANGPADASSPNAFVAPGTTDPQGGSVASPGVTSNPGNARTPARGGAGPTPRPTTTPTSRGTTGTTALPTPSTIPTSKPTTPTTQPTTTTTRAHGPPTSVTHGPPSVHGKKG